jgi:CspA family cold shock protein
MIGRPPDTPKIKTGGFIAAERVNAPKRVNPRICAFLGIYPEAGLTGSRSGFFFQGDILSHCARTQTKERLLMEGHIKWYDEKKRFGFVTTQENEDIFLHVSGIKEYGHFGLQRDDRVEFEIKETAKGKQAVNLRPVK